MMFGPNKSSSISVLNPPHFSVVIKCFDYFHNTWIEIKEKKVHFMHHMANVIKRNNEAYCFQNDIHFVLQERYIPYYKCNKTISIHWMSPVYSAD